MSRQYAWLCPECVYALDDQFESAAAARPSDKTACAFCDVEQAPHDLRFGKVPVRLLDRGQTIVRVARRAAPRPLDPMAALVEALHRPSGASARFRVNEDGQFVLGLTIGRAPHEDVREQTWSRADTAKGALLALACQGPDGMKVTLAWLQASGALRTIFADVLAQLGSAEEVLAHVDGPVRHTARTHLRTALAAMHQVVEPAAPQSAEPP